METRLSHGIRDARGRLDGDVSRFVRWPREELVANSRKKFNRYFLPVSEFQV